MEAVSWAFIGVGIIIIIGLLANRLMELTFLPEPFVIVLLGMFLSNFLGGGELLLKFAPYLANLALALILFEAGSNIELKKFISEITPAGKFALLSYSLTFLFSFLSLHSLAKIPLPESIILGFLFGGTSAAAVVPLAQQLGEVKDILELESTITNVFTTIFTLTAAQMLMTTALNAKEAIHNVISAFSIGIFFGLIFGAFWIKILRKLKTYSFTLTFAILLILYGTVEFIGGNGGVAALVFGLLLGNTSDISKLLKITQPRTAELITFHRELSFFIRTFFFLLTGILAVSKPLDFAFLFPASLIVFSSYLGRLVAAKISKLPKVVSYVLPKGLAEAVIAFILISANLIKFEGLIQLTAFVLLLSSLFSSALLLRYASRASRDA